LIKIGFKVEKRCEVVWINMNCSKEDSVFWSLAKKYSILEVPSTENVATLNEAEVPVKVNLLSALLNNFPTHEPNIRRLNIFHIM
jgi:hypothetical protein